MPLWNADEFGLLRVDFDKPTDFVKIDFAFDDDDRGSLIAFDPAGHVLAEDVGAGDGRGPDPTYTAAIHRDTPDIAYVLAGGVGSEALYLDNLEYNIVPTDTTFLHGGAGNDTIYADGTAAPINYPDGYADTLYGDDGDDEIFGSYGNDLIYGGTGDDRLWGQSENDTVYGGTGNDTMGGGSGNDTLYGEADNDVLAGTDGADKLSGGTGNDVYDFDYVTESPAGAANRDVVLDYNGVGAAVGDRIDLSTIDANTGVSGNQAFVFKGAGAITGAGQVHLIASGTDTLVQANTGGSTAPEMEILVHDGTALHTQWVVGDFIL